MSLYTRFISDSTRSVRAARSSLFVMPDVSTGSRTVSVAVPGKKMGEPGVEMRSVPSMITGSTGRPVSIAMRKAPLWKGSNADSVLRVPSGNTISEFPLSLASWTPSLMAWRDDPPFDLLISMIPTVRIPCAKSGILKSSAFARNRPRMGRYRMRIGMSYMERWFETMT